MDEYLKELYYDKPIKYKELLIYPAIMKDYLDFHLYVGCLLLDKNSTPDPEIISMSYLRFLYYISEKEELPYLYMFKSLLNIVLHINDDKDFSFYIRDNKAYFKVEDCEYDSDDFNNISKIIMYQNCIDPIDNTIQKEIRDELEKAERLKQEINENKICSLEEQMICVMISTSLKLEDIYNLTIRKFEKTLKRVDAKLHYQIYLNASLSGMVQFKDKSFIQHWMNDLSKKDKYSDVKVDMDEMRNKIDGINK